MEPTGENFYLTEEILNRLSDADLSQMCAVSKQYQRICNNDKFWQMRAQRLIHKDVLKQKPEESTWKEWYQLTGYMFTHDGAEQIIKSDNVDKFNLMIQLTLDLIDEIDTNIFGHYHMNVLKYIVEYNSRNIFRYLVIEGQKYPMAGNPIFITIMEILSHAVYTGNISFLQYAFSLHVDIRHFNYYLSQTDEYDPLVVLSSYPTLWNNHVRADGEEISWFISDMIQLDRRTKRIRTVSIVLKYIPLIKWLSRHNVPFPDDDEVKDILDYYTNVKYDDEEKLYYTSIINDLRTTIARLT